MLDAKQKENGMADVDVDQWLEGWVENNLTAPGYVEAKAELRDQAEACAV